MTSPTLGVVVLLALLAVGAGVTTAIILMEIKGRRTASTRLAGVAAVAAVAGALCFFVAPVSVQGTFCMYGGASDGLLRDATAAVDELTAPCLHQARRIVGWWSLAVVATVAVWSVSLARSGRRTPSGALHG